MKQGSLLMGILIISVSILQAQDSTAMCRHNLYVKRFLLNNPQYSYDRINWHPTMSALSFGWYTQDFKGRFDTASDAYYMVRRSERKNFANIFVGIAACLCLVPYVFPVSVEARQRMYYSGLGLAGVYFVVNISSYHDLKKAIAVHNASPPATE